MDNDPPIHKHEFEHLCYHTTLRCSCGLVGMDKCDWEDEDAFEYAILYQLYKRDDANEAEASPATE